MAHRGKPKKRFFRKKKDDNVIPLNPPHPGEISPCLACDLLNMSDIIRGHPRKGHTDKDTGKKCTCWCNQ